MALEKRPRPDDLTKASKKGRFSDGQEDLVINRQETSGKEPTKTTGKHETILLDIKFPPHAMLPSISDLKSKFAPFGPFDKTAVRVSGTSRTSQLRFFRKDRVQAAYRHACQTASLFSTSDVSCHLRDFSISTIELKNQSASCNVQILTALNSNVSTESESSSFQMSECDKSLADINGNSGNSRNAGCPSSFHRHHPGNMSLMDEHDRVADAFNAIVLKHNQLQATKSCDYALAPTEKGPDISLQLFSLLQKCAEVVEKAEGSSVNTS